MELLGKIHTVTKHMHTQHCTCTARSSQTELNYRYLSDTAVPTGVTEGQTGSDWIRYYAWMGGGGSS